MIAALGTDPSVAVQLLRVDQLLTLRALDPQVLGDLDLAVLVSLPRTEIDTALEKVSHRRSVLYRLACVKPARDFDTFDDRPPAPEADPSASIRHPSSGNKAPQGASRPVR